LATRDLLDAWTTGGARVRDAVVLARAVAVRDMAACRAAAIARPAMAADGVIRGAQ
jgi:hypothetical protein